MEVTIDVKYTLVCLVLLALAVFLVYLTILIKNLITTTKKLNEVVDDASVVTAIASNAATHVDGIVSQIGAGVEDAAKAHKSGNGVVGAVSNVAKAVNSVASRKSDTVEGKTRKQRRR